MSWSRSGVLAGAITRQNASTTSGSNCVPAQRRSSSMASVSGIGSRYGRSVVMASKASQTDTMRAPSGISSPRRPSG